MKKILPNTDPMAALPPGGNTALDGAFAEAILKECTLNPAFF
jgi:hypothetical protein